MQGIVIPDPPDLRPLPWRHITGLEVTGSTSGITEYTLTRPRPRALPVASLRQRGSSTELGASPELSVAVSIHLGCKRTPQTGRLINNRHLFLTVVEAGKSKIMVLADLVSGGVRFLVQRPSSSHCVLTAWRGWELSLGSLL